MATLEKIRQRKKILAIVIGAALLAFIIEAGIEAIGRMGGPTSVAKVGSEKIDIMKFQHRVEQEAARDQDNNSRMDAATRQQNVLNEMINETLLNDEYEKVGIYVTDNEISELMIGKNAAPAAVQFAQQAGAESPEQLFDFLSNPSKYGAQESQLAELRNAWNQLRDELVAQLKQLKLSTLVGGALQANDLDRAQMAEDEASTSYITFVKQDLNSLPDDKFTPTEQEIKELWNKEKNLYAIDEQNRTIHFIAVNITPSPEDMAAAAKVADDAWAALQQGTGLDAVRALGKVSIDTVRNPLDKFTTPDIKGFVQSAAVGATKRDSTGGRAKYRMHKLINKISAVDSVQLAMLTVVGAKSAQDSALTMLNGGASIDSIANLFKGSEAQPEQWFTILTTADSIKQKLLNAGNGFFVMNSNDRAAQIVKVLDKKAPKTFYTLATISYEAYASQKTIDKLRNDFQDYLNANKNIKDFEDSAAKKGYNAVPTTITPSTPQLSVSPYGGGLKDTRKAIKWAFDAKKGDISPIFSDNNDVFVAVAVDDIYDNGYIPATDPSLNESLKAKVMAKKKADAIFKKVNGKAQDLAGYASLMGAQIDTTTVVFSRDAIDKIGNEPGLVGAVVCAKPGKLQVYKGEHGVYAFQVNRVEKSDRQPTKEELDQRFSQQRGAQMTASPQGLAAILGKATKIKRSLIDFY